MGEKITLFFGIASFAASIFTFYGASVRKRYAAERAFKHLENDLKSLSSNIATLTDLLDLKLDQVQRTVDKVETRQDIILNQTGRPREDR